MGSAGKMSRAYVVSAVGAAAKNRKWIINQEAV